jgi:protein-S-isoprenylcysteine O-methyltransferase
MPQSVPLFASSPIRILIFWLSFMAWFALEYWIVRRDRLAVQGVEADRGSARLLVRLVYAGIFLAFACGYGVAATRIAWDPGVVFATAIALMWAGIGLRIWAVRTLGRFFRTAIVVQDDHELITAGPYRYLRNPSYSGALITIAGFGLAMGNWLSLVCAVGAALFGYAWRIRVEEAALSARFGEVFETYRKGSWAIIPLVW